MSKTPTDQEIQNFQPKCLERVLPGRGIAVSATGFVLPCCWLDQAHNTEKDEKIAPLFDDKLHIDNNDTIEDIISSKPWQKFMHDLIEKPEDSSPICFRKCTTAGNPHRVKKTFE